MFVSYIYHISRQFSEPKCSGFGLYGPSNAVGVAVVVYFLHDPLNTVGVAVVECLYGLSQDFFRHRSVMPDLKRKRGLEEQHAQPIHIPAPCRLRISKQFGFSREVNDI